MAITQKAAFTIPTVDISAYLKKPDSVEAQRVVSEIRLACKTSGFFQIINHGIPHSLQASVLHGATRLFGLPIEEKNKLRSAQGRGYETIGSQTLEKGTKPDMKEVSPQ